MNGLMLNFFNYDQPDKEENQEGNETNYCLQTQQKYILSLLDLFEKPKYTELARKVQLYLNSWDCFQLYRKNIQNLGSDQLR